MYFNSNALFTEPRRKELADNASEPADDNLEPADDSTTLADADGRSSTLMLALSEKPMECSLTGDR